MGERRHTQTLLSVASEAKPVASESTVAVFHDIVDLDSPLGQEMLRIYERAFPESERDPVTVLAAELRNDDPDTELTRIRALVDGGMVVGFAYFSSYRAYNLGYLKFIAVREDIRGKGYGPLLLQDAVRQLCADGRAATGWPYLGLVLEVERPETADTESDRQLRERRIQFYQRNGALMIDGTDFIAPPVTEGQPSLPFHLMMLRAVPKSGMRRWLRQKAVKALLLEGYDQSPDSWFVRHALDVCKLVKETTTIRRLNLNTSTTATLTTTVTQEIAERCITP